MVEECVDARREDLVVVVCEFLVGSHQFHQGMPQIATDLLLVFWRTLNPEFFVGLGFEEVFYDSQTQKLKAMKISEEIDRIIRYYSKYYKGLSFLQILTLVRKPILHIRFCRSFVHLAQRFNH